MNRDTIKINHPDLNGGFAFDFYTTSSEKLADGSFKNTYSPLGKLIHELLYTSPTESQYIKKLNEILELIKPHIDGLIFFRIKDLVITPMPPTNKNRPVQPVFELAKMIAKYKDCEYQENIFEKISTQSSKSMPANQNFKPGDFKINSPNKPISLLIIDDTYGSGRTLNAVLKLAKNDPNIDHIYFISIVKNRSKGSLARWLTGWHDE